MVVNTPTESRKDLIKPLLMLHLNQMKRNLHYLQLLWSAFLRGRAAPRLALKSNDLPRRSQNTPKDQVRKFTVLKN